MNATATNSSLAHYRGILWILLMTILVFLLFSLAAAWIGKTETDAPRTDRVGVETETPTQGGNQ